MPDTPTSTHTFILRARVQGAGTGYPHLVDSDGHAHDLADWLRRSIRVIPDGTGVRLELTAEVTR